MFDNIWQELSSKDITPYLDVVDFIYNLDLNVISNYPKSKYPHLYYKEGKEIYHHMII